MCIIICELYIGNNPNISYLSSRQKCHDDGGTILNAGFGDFTKSNGKCLQEKCFILIEPQG
jgi:hypothetical protein